MTTSWTPWTWSASTDARELWRLVHDTDADVIVVVADRLASDELGELLIADGKAGLRCTAIGNPPRPSAAVLGSPSLCRRG